MKHAIIFLYSVTVMLILGGCDEKTKPYKYADFMDKGEEIPVLPAKSKQ